MRSYNTVRASRNSPLGQRFLGAEGEHGIRSHTYIHTQGHLTHSMYKTNPASAIYLFLLPPHTQQPLPQHVPLPPGQPGLCIPPFRHVGPGPVQLQHSAGGVREGWVKAQPKTHRGGLLERTNTFASTVLGKEKVEVTRLFCPPKQRRRFSGTSWVRHYRENIITTAGGNSPFHCVN